MLFANVFFFLELCYQEIKNHLLIILVNALTLNSLSIAQHAEYYSELDNVNGICHCSHCATDTLPFTLLKNIITFKTKRPQFVYMCVVWHGILSNDLDWYGATQWPQEH